MQVAEWKNKFETIAQKVNGKFEVRILCRGMIVHSFIGKLLTMHQGCILERRVKESGGTCTSIKLFAKQRRGAYGGIELLGISP